ncbi:Rho GTPase-activating protein 32 [Ameca splendens]|uniref:Rho GTPase-activating protein 32 n=1 Tax=Ameca splendens TaxID=208324 RepID=A0ABV0ZB29_9TELE
MYDTMCVDFRSLRPGGHIEDDNIVPELAHIHPRERPDWEETISAMARSAEIPELRAEPLIRSCSSSTASMKVKNVKKLSFTKGHFPKLAECAHFHYENVDFGTIQRSKTRLSITAVKPRLKTLPAEREREGQELMVPDQQPK